MTGPVRIWRFALLGLLLLVACRDHTTTPSLRGSFSPSIAPSTLTRLRPEEVAFAELGERAPSSAGFYLNANGELVAFVRDQQDETNARSALVDIASRSPDSRIKSATVRIERGRYTFRQLAGWRDAIFDNILGTVPGVVFLDLTEQLNRLTIGVSPREAAILRLQLPGKLTELGVDTGAVTYRVQEPIRGLASSPRELTSGILVAAGVMDWFESVFGGIRIQTGAGMCTLGIVADNGTGPGIVTDSHCSQQMWSLDNGPIYQPAPSRQVGTEAVDPPGYGCGLFGLNTCRGSDASFYAVTGGVSSYRGLIARTLSSAGPGSGHGSLDINPDRPFFIVTAADQSDAIGGERVQKVGITSGWTWGTIGSTCADHHNGGLFNWYPGSNVTICIYGANILADSGDSGSPVFRLEGNGYTQATDLVRIMGLIIGHAGGETVFSKWGRITEDLGPLVATRNPTLSQPSVTGSKEFNAARITWSSVAGATRYNVYRAGSSGPELATVTTSTSILDPINILEYTGAVPGNTQYYIYAVSGTEVSPVSNTIWFRAASGTFSVTIAGPTVVGPNSYDCSSWFAQVSGASNIISHEWSGLFASSAQSVQGTVLPPGGELRLLVVDDQGRQGAHIISITYDPNNQAYCP